ncbi:MAG: glycosyltransferase family 9 protein [Candidatus Muiribacteriota bacterium]
MKVLFARLDHIGDCFLSLPAVYEFKQNFPDSECHILCKKNTKEIFAKSSLFKKIYTINLRHTCNPYEKKESFKAIFKKIKSIRKENYDYIFNFRPHFKDSFFLYLLKGKLINAPLPLYSDKVHILVKNKINLARAFGYITFREKNYVKLNLNQKKYISEVKISKVKNSILFFTGGFKLKKLSDEKIISLYKKLKEKKLDIKLVKSIYDSKIKGVTQIEINNVLEWISLVENSRGAICFDTGPMHLAAAHGKKLFAVFGPTSTSYFGPTGTHTEFIDYGENIKFIPGDKKRDSLNSCLQNVDITELGNKIETFFNSEIID